MIVVATINLPGLSAGRIAEVDPKIPYIRDCLWFGYLVPLELEPELEPEEP